MRVTDKRQKDKKLINIFLSILPIINPEMANNNTNILAINLNLFMPVSFLEVFS